MCYVWYFGELTKLCAYSVWCYLFQVLVRIAGRRRPDQYTHGIFMLWDLGIFICYGFEFQTLMFLWILNELCFYKMQKIVLKFTVLQVGIRALVWGIRVHLRAYLNSNWGFEKYFQKRTKFSKKSKRFLENAEQSRVYDQPAPERWFPKIPSYYVLWYWYDVFPC